MEEEEGERQKLHTREEEREEGRERKIGRKREKKINELER